MRTALKWLAPAFLVLFFAVPCLATEIQLENETLNGKILGKEGGEIFFETSAGIINIRKADILSIDGRPYAYTPPKPAAAPAPAPTIAEVPSQEAPSGEEKPSYLGYVPLAERRSETGKPGANVGVQFGTVENPAPAGTVTAPQNENWDDMPVHPEGVTEKELRDYYNAHREEFREPLKVHVRSLGQAFFTRGIDEIRNDPISESGWRDAGWIDYGQTVEPFEAATLSPIFSLGVGGVSPLLRDKNGVAYLLWVVERKESEIPPYEQSRPKVLNKILRSDE